MTFWVEKKEKSVSQKFVFRLNVNKPPPPTQLSLLRGRGVPEITL